VTGYLLKVNICVALFYAVYLVLFRHTNRLQLNRAFLLLGLLLSFLAPLIILTSSPIDLPLKILNGNTIMDSLNSGEASGALNDNYFFLSYLYYCGVAISLLITLVSLLKLFRIYLSSDKLGRHHGTLRIHPNIQPFSLQPS